MLESGQSARRVSNIFSNRFYCFPSGSLDHNPLCLLIHFHKFQGDFALGQAGGIELRIADCGLKKSAI
jgi:hypothetical protein